MKYVIAMALSIGLFACSEQPEKIVHQTVAKSFDYSMADVENEYKACLFTQGFDAHGACEDQCADIYDGESCDAVDKHYETKYGIGVDKSKHKKLKKLKDIKVKQSEVKQRSLYKGSPKSILTSKSTTTKTIVSPTSNSLFKKTEIKVKPKTHLKKPLVHEKPKVWEKPVPKQAAENTPHKNTTKKTVVKKEILTKKKV